jgi:hypothetical protein
MPDKSSQAINAGAVVALGVASTAIFNDVALDRSYAFILVNNSDTDMTLVLDGGTGAITSGAGVVLKSGGGSWREENYAGALRGRHHGVSGTKDLSVVVF